MIFYIHVSLATLVKDYEPLTEEERTYARNPLTHVDFLLFNQMDKQACAGDRSGWDWLS